MKKVSLFGLFLIGCFINVLWGGNAFALDIVRVTPEGEDVSIYKDEILIKFDSDMAALGYNTSDKSKKNNYGIKITPEISCDWQWIAADTLVCRRMLGKWMVDYATEYSIHIPKEIKDLNGKSLEKDYVFTFQTERAKVTRVDIYNSPDDNRINSPFSPKAALTFNTGINPDTLFLTFNTKSKGNIPAKKECDKYKKGLSGCFIYPISDLPYNESIELVLHKGLRVLKGGTLKGRRQVIKTFINNEEIYKGDVVRIDSWRTKTEPIFFVDAPLYTKRDSFYFLVNGEKYISASTTTYEKDYEKLGHYCWDCERGSKKAIKVYPKEPLPENSYVYLYSDETETLGGTKIPSQRIAETRTYGELKYTGASCYVDYNITKKVKSPSKYSHIRCRPHRYVYSYEPFKFEFSNPVRKVKIRYRNNSRKIKKEEFSCYRDKTCDTSVNVPGKLHIYNISAEDIFGEKINQKVDIKIRVGDYPRRNSLNIKTAILEKDAKSEVPLYVTNSDSFGKEYRIYTVDGRVTEHKGIKTSYLKNRLDFKVPLDVRKLLNGKSGVVEVFGDGDVETFYQITPFHVHLKLGEYKSLVWVTNFSDGKPVSDAKIELLALTKSKDDENYRIYSGDYRILSVGNTDQNGVAYLTGFNSFESILEKVRFYWWKYYWQDEGKDKRLVAKVTKGNDIAILPVSSVFSDYWNHPTTFSHKKAWGTTTQGVYKRGDKVSYKFIIRDQDIDNLTIPEKRDNYTVTIYDPLNNTVKECKDVKLSDFGTISGDFKLAKTAKVGWYRIKLDFYEQEIKFLVSDFKPAPYKAKSILNKKQYKVGEKALLDTSAKFYAGAPLAYAKLTIDAKVYPRTISPRDKKLKEFNFSKENASDYHSKDLYKTDKLKLDKDGVNQAEIAIQDLNIPYGKIALESSVIDERGKSVASSAGAAYFGMDRFLGIKDIGWLLYTDKTYQPQFVIIDENENIVSDGLIDIEIKRLETKVVKQKDASDVYRNHYSKEWSVVNTAQLNFKGKPVTFDFKPEKGGDYKLFAKVSDTHGKVYGISKEYYVVPSAKDKDEYIIHEDEDELRLSITPVKESYRVGETAKFLVKNPYPNSYAIFTKERYGVKSEILKFLSSTQEVIEIPVEEDDIPGIYITGVVMTPRNKDLIIPKEELDTYSYYDNDSAKPKYSYAKAEIKVLGDEKELKIKVSSDKNEYKPAEHVGIDIEVKNKSGKGVVSETAVIVLDQSVFDLINDGISYFNPYDKFNRLVDNHGVYDYNIMRQLLGEISFLEWEKFQKGKNPAGDGLPEQNSDLRKNFKYVPYWNPNILTDEEGRAHIEFDLPDNLTTFRVIAFSVDKKDKMGFGYSDFLVNQPIQIRSIMPNQVRVTDLFEARATVLNSTTEEKVLNITYQADGPIDDKDEHTQVVTLKPFERYVVALPLKVQGYGKIKMKVSARSGVESDATEMSLNVSKRANKESVAFYKTILAKEKGTKGIISLHLPSKIIKGKLKFSAVTSLVSSLEGVFSYMRDYPYPCWEQKLSRSLVSAFYEVFRDTLPKSFVWKDGGRSFTESMLNKAGDYQAPNGGMAFFVPYNEYVSPYLSAFTAVGFNWLRKLNYKIPEKVEKELHRYLEMRLLNDNHLTTRILAVTALSEHDKVKLNDVKRLFNEKDKMDLFDKAFLLQALINLKADEEDKANLLKDILNYSDETGGHLSFKDNKGFNWWTLGSQVKSDCVLLSTFCSYFEKASYKGKRYLGDIPEKLARTIVSSKGKNGAWGNTQENIFCTKALIDYQNTFESGEIDLTLNSKLFGEDLPEMTFTKKSTKAKESIKKLSPLDSDKKGNFDFEAKGQGKAYCTARIDYYSSAELPSFNAGMSVNRGYFVLRGDKFIEIKDGEKLKIGDIVKVKLFVTLPAERTYVVLEDPLPAGLEPVNTDLATSSKLYEENNPVEFYFKELTHEVVRFYADYVGGGSYTLTYAAQVVAKGEFRAPAPKIEEMYTPEVFGRGEDYHLSVN